MDAFPPGPKSKRAAWPPKVKESLKSREPDVLRSGYNPMRGFAGFVSVPDMKTLLGDRHGKASPCVRRRTKPACRTPGHKEGVQQNPIKKNGLECRKPMRHDIRPKGFSCEMKNAHQHYARKE